MLLLGLIQFANRFPSSLCSNRKKLIFCPLAAVSRKGRCILDLLGRNATSFPFSSLSFWAFSGPSLFSFNCFLRERKHIFKWIQLWPGHFLFLKALTQAYTKPAWIRSGDSLQDLKAHLFSHHFSGLFLNPPPKAKKRPGKWSRG